MTVFATSPPPPFKPRNDRWNLIILYTIFTQVTILTPSLLAYHFHFYIRFHVIAVTQYLLKAVNPGGGGG